LAFIGSLALANTRAAASIADSFLSFASLDFFAAFVSFGLVDFFVGMLGLLDCVFNGLAAIVRPGEPPPSDALARVSA